MTYAERSGAARGDGRHLLRGHLRKRMPLGQLRTTTPRWEAGRQVGGSAGRRICVWIVALHAGPRGYSRLPQAVALHSSVSFGKAQTPAGTALARHFRFGRAPSGASPPASSTWPPRLAVSVDASAEAAKLYQRRRIKAPRLAQKRRDAESRLQTPVARSFQAKVRLTVADWTGGRGLRYATPAVANRLLALAVGAAGLWCSTERMLRFTGARRLARISKLGRAETNT
ncbi:hypothetical protein L1887_62660 [Cichorium endivia]|nr:hypothetical protein L1887_62660 [Cichorium endivia]